MTLTDPSSNLKIDTSSALSNLLADSGSALNHLTKEKLAAIVRGMTPEQITDVMIALIKNPASAQKRPR